jgi:hypothetical protein
MTYQVSWDGPSADDPDRGYEVEISTVAELDAVLDQVAVHAATEKVPFAVQVHDDAAPGSVMLGVGHPERSFVDWLVPDGLHQYAYEPKFAPGGEPIGFDVYGDWREHPPEKLRVHPGTAREAAREYVRTGRRPTGVEWAE